MRSLFMREDCYTLRGLCMTFIVLHHVFQYTAMQYAVHYPMLVAILMQSLGYLCTAVFFLLSGYGVHCSLAREQASCHTLSVGYVGSRLFRLLLPFLRLGLFTALLVLLCDVQRFGIGCEVPQSLTAVLSSLGSLSLPIGGNVWFFKVIIALYLLTYLVSLFTSSAQRRIALIALFVIGWIAFALYMDMGSNWYNSVLCFPLGMLCAHCREALTRLLTRRTLIVLSALLLLAYAGQTYGLSHYCLAAVKPWLTPCAMIACGLLFALLAVVVASHITLRHPLLTFIGTNSLAFYLAQSCLLQCYGVPSLALYLAVVLIGTPLLAWGIGKAPFATRAERSHDKGR